MPLTWRLRLLIWVCRLCDAHVDIVLHFDCTLVFGVLWAVADKQAQVTADNLKWRRCAVTVNVLPFMVSRTAKDTGQELEDTIYSILLALVSLAGGQRFLPEVLNGSLEFVEVSGDCLLMALDSCDPTDDGVDVQDLSALARDGHITVRMLGVLLAAAICFLLGGDKTEKIGLPAVKIRVLPVRKFSVGIALQGTLSEVKYLVESVHIQRANKRS
jgi:hypothetical protein